MPWETLRGCRAFRQATGNVLARLWLRERDSALRLTEIARSRDGRLPQKAASTANLLCGVLLTDYDARQHFDWQA